jgi:predicted GNAT family acetyltransferase
MSLITVRNNPERSRFEVLDGGIVVGKAAYVDHGSTERIFYHTVVDEEYGGQGLGARLAADALDGTVAQGLRIVPVCPYISKYLKRHLEYAANVQAPTPALLEFLSGSLAQRASR